MIKPARVWGFREKVNPESNDKPARVWGFREKKKLTQNPMINPPGFGSHVALGAVCKRIRSAEFGVFGKKKVNPKSNDKPGFGVSANFFLKAKSNDKAGNLF